MNLFGKKDGDQTNEANAGSQDIQNGISFSATPRPTFAGQESGKGFWVLAILIIIGSVGGGYYYISAQEAASFTPPPAQVEAMPAEPSPVMADQAAPPAEDPAAAQSAALGEPPAQPADTAADVSSVPSADAAAAPAPSAAADAQAAPVTAEPADASAKAEQAEAPVTVVNADQTMPATAPEAAVVATEKSAQPEPAAKDAAKKPDAAELAIVQNAAVLDTLDTPANAETVTSTNNGPRVTDILAESADVRPLPEKYLVVRKDQDADNADARLTAARAALSQGRNQAALELFDDLYKKNPADKRGLMGRAVALQRLGQTDQALAAYELVLRDDPKNIEALTNMLGLLKGQSSETAVEKLRQLRDIYPSNADVTAQLGTVYGATGNYDEALKYLDMADALKPGNPNILYNRAVVYDRMGNTGKAADLYRQIIALAANGNLDQSFPIDAVRKRLAVLR